MCARRFLLVILFLTLLAVAGAFAMFQFGDRVLLKTTVPKGHFTAPPPASGPDYAQAQSWIARSGIADDPSQWRPLNEARVDPIAVDARVFYIHPTTYLEREGWNAALQPDGETESRTRLFVQSQASAFNQDAEIWAPRYRQAAFGAFLLDSADARSALDLAYSDIAAAFDHFLNQVPPESPIILAGHSQGALHLERLLRDKVAGKPVAKRLVAAYVVGWPLSTTADLPALGLPACRSPDQAGCILSWMSFAEPANPELILGGWQKSKGPTGTSRRRDDILCVNPLTGSEGGAAPPRSNTGTLVPSADLRSATLAPGQVGARCDRGLLILEGAIPPLGPYVLPGNNYHVYDFALFWDAIRADALRRANVWRPQP